MSFGWGLGEGSTGPMQTLVNGRWINSNDPRAIEYSEGLRSAAANRDAQERAAMTSAIEKLASQADPFAAQRSQYQMQLKDLMTNPSGAVASNPFFKASADQGMEAAKRRLAQMGMGDSGNAALELQKASQANLSDSYFKMADLLSGLSGGKADPSAGASAALGLTKLYEDQRQFDKGPNRHRTYVGGRETSMPMSGLLGAYRGY